MVRCYVPHRVGHQLTLGLPVILENDANTLTAAEQWFGLGHGVDHFIAIVVGSGISAGIGSLFDPRTPRDLQQDVTFLVAGWRK